MDSRLRRQLFHDTLRIRLIEEEIAARYGEQEMRTPVHLSIGQEACAVGACAALRTSDYAFGSHRSHGHYLAKGGDLTAMLAELYGRATGCCRGKGGSMHLVDLKVGFLGATSIVASTIPIAAGSAFASKLRGEDRVTAVFLGEAATEEGVFHEAANFATLHKLPLVFFCENNLYSVYSGLEVRQPAHRPTWASAKGHGLRVLYGDGNDLEEAYELSLKSVDAARAGEGPVFLELATYRWREHCGHNYDNHIGYRTEAEYQAWRARCPIERAQQRLIADGLLGAAEVDEMRARIDAEVKAAFEAARNAPWPEPEEMATQVYAEGANAT
ncbi:MAG: thiamine pyrophosphate-dependent dehydrogenase E1 component subunit alpha [Planctomycetota bacterium]|nr:thiamine pyrophosphate-dependent dehydrogenase E1 component subunit alpha [Planctomycetota bacterium]